MPVNVQRLAVTFGDRKVLDDITVTFAAGTVSAVMGPSGAGKSTLLAAIVGYIRVDRGHIDLDGVDRHQIAFVAQSAPLISKRSAEDNIAIGAMATGLDYLAATERARVLLEELGIGQLALTPAFRLSGGERQRVAILRAIAVQSPILLADEPTASLDAASRAAICSALKFAASNGAVVIVATHDSYVASESDAVFDLWASREQ